MFSLKRQSLVFQIALAASCVSLAIFAALIGFTSYFTERYALAKTEKELTQQVQGLVHMLHLSHSNAVAQADRSLARIKGKLGALRIGPDTMASGPHQIPVVRSGDQILNANTALLESLRSLADADPALLVRSGDDFVRAATLLKDKDGNSTQGTTLPGSNPEVRALLAGKPYTGVVKRAGKFYVSAIEPITDGNGKVVGALAARVNIQADMDRLMKAVAEIKSGSTGYAYILAPSAKVGDTEFIAHPTLSGKTVGEINNPAMNDIVEEQLRRKQGARPTTGAATPAAPPPSPRWSSSRTSPAGTGRSPPAASSTSSPSRPASCATPSSACAWPVRC